MLSMLRRQRRLTLGVLGAFVLALMAALVTAVPTRNALPLALEICTSTGSSSTVALGHEVHGNAGLDTEAGTAPGHHADPACVLCLAWTAPPDATVAAYRPPAPGGEPLWWLRSAPQAERFTARPPPLRGPPVSALA